VYDYPQEFTEKHVPKMFDYIFQRQRELMIKYREIESKNGFHYPESLVVNIDDRFDQTLLKNMSWRTIEEVGESLESYFNPTDDKLHAKEELADGLHFITELVILSGYNEKNLIYFDFNEAWYSLNSANLDTLVTNFVLKIGIAMNCLKMKPWKQTHVKTDIINYRNKLVIAYQAYIRLMLFMMKPIELLNLYFSKSDVNKFRIRSNY
jgi:hypothetical protein